MYSKVFQTTRAPICPSQITLLRVVLDYFQKGNASSYKGGFFWGGFFWGFLLLLLNGTEKLSRLFGIKYVHIW